MIESTITPGIYEHYKGGRYEVIGVGLFEADEQPVVIYKTLYENDKSELWVRPVTSFEETVEVNGEVVPRFRRVEA
jgi:hypothetical protein